MKIYITSQADDQTSRPWRGETPPPAQEELLRLLPAANRRDALAVQGSSSNVYLLGLRLPVPRGGCVLVSELEESQARSLALAYLLHHDDLCRELEACFCSPQAAERVQQTLENYVSRTPVSRETPLYEGLDTADLGRMIECLRRRRFINGPGLKLIVSESGAASGEEVDLRLRCDRHRVEPKVAIALGFVGLVLLGCCLYALVPRPKTEPVQVTPAAAPAQVERQAAPMPESGKLEDKENYTGEQ